MKKISIILFSCLVSLSLWAEDISFQAAAPAKVVVGQPFQLTYTISANSTTRSSNLLVPEFTDFEVLAGPYTSSSSSTQWINGTRTSSFTQTYTYTLIADNEGTFSIQPARITAGQQELTSNGLKIQVLPADKSEQNTSNNTNTGSNESTNISKENIFMRTIVSRTQIKEQECFSVAYKLYFAGVDVAQLGNNTKIPEFKGFLKQEVDLGEIQIDRENYNGRNYQTATLYKVLLFPQKTGEIVIEPANFEAILRVRQQAQVRSIFDGWFDTYTNIAKQLTAPAVTINVEALPSGKPSDFSGGVGHFTMTHSISSTDLQTNDAITLRIEIKGQGNMKMLKTPDVDWPDNFEIYDPKVNNDFKVNSSTLSGTKTIEYLAIPRASGDYTIPPITFSYFDTDANQYRQLSTPAYNIHVAKNNNGTEPTIAQSFVSKEDIKQLGTDIRYISSTYKPAKQPLLKFGSWLFWLCYITPLLIAIVLFIVFRKRIRENADLAKVRFKKANKVAQKRLKRAKQLMEEQHKEAFYEEIERAALTYMSDRLNIPTANLNKDNIASILQDKHAPQDIIDKVINLLTDAEFARYAPAASDHQMSDMYNRTSQLIDQLERELKL